MQMFKWLWKLAMDQRGEDNPGSSEAPMALGAAGGDAPGSVDTGVGGESGQAGEAPVTTPKFGEFGDDPNEAAPKLFETFSKTKSDFDNFKTKAGLTERNLATMRKALEMNGIRFNEQGQLELIKQAGPERKVRFTDEHKQLFDPKVLESMRLLVQDLFDEQYDGRERTTQEQRAKMQQFMAEKQEVEELMVGYFPQLNKEDSNFNQAFFDMATQIWEEQYNKNPLKQLSAALRAAQELKIIPQMIAAAKKEGVEKGKQDKKILAPVGGSGAPSIGGKRISNSAEYLALSPEERAKFDAESLKRKQQ